MALYFQKIRAGLWVSGSYTIKRSLYGSHQWNVYDGDTLLGFRPTLELAKRLAERMGKAA